jgi:GT2 family glycosyltransferase
MLYPDALRTLLAEAKRQSCPAILTLAQYNAETGALVDRGLRLDPFLNPVPNLDSGRLEVSMVHGACLWLPADLWHKIGGFPEWFHMLAEDMYLCSAVRLQGGAVIVPADSGYRHHIGYSIGGGKPQDMHLVTTCRRRALSERNKNFVMFLCYPLPALLVIFPLHASLLVIEGALMAMIRRNRQIFSRIYLSSLTSLWLHRNLLCTGRRDLQKGRTTGTVRFFSTFTWLPHKLRLLLRHGFPDIRG